MRYFGAKYDMVLFVFDAFQKELVSALHAQPGGTPDWSALRQAMEPVVDSFTGSDGDGLAIMRLVGQTPAMRTHLREKIDGWRIDLIRAFAGSGRLVPVKDDH